MPAKPMDFIVSAIEGFVNQLPPLLQLMLGAAIVGGSIKLIIVTVDFFEKKRGEKK